MNACTIASRSQLARARVLVATFHEHNSNPKRRFTVLMLDGVAGVNEVQGAQMLKLDELLGESGGLTVAGNPRDALDAAVLPHLLRHLLMEDGGPVAYLAPGLRVLGPLFELEQMLKQDELVLVARAAPERMWDASAFGGHAGGGALSRRLLAVRPGGNVAGLLDSWPRWFVDDAAVQAWFDGIPAIAESAAVLREPGYGLDPWTLATWGADGKEGELEVGRRAARIFDFSGLDPLEPNRLLDSNDAVKLSRVPALANLCDREARELLEMGYVEDTERSQGLDVLVDGTRITSTLRELLVEAVGNGRLLLSPFTEKGRMDFYAYLNEPAERGRAVGLTRLHMAIWDNRVDLQSAYPHLDGPDGAGFAGWLCLYGTEQEGLVSELLPPTPELAYRDANPHAHEEDRRWGVNVAGFFTAELGVGEAARLLISGLDATSVPALPVQGHLMPPSRQEVEFAYARIDEAAYPINIVCINGDGIPVFAREAGRSFFEGRYTIALWWWEVGDPPASWSKAYEFVDEVWVASQHIYDALAPTSPVPVVRIGLPVVEPEVVPRTRAELGLPEEGFIFLYVHDYHSVAARKNPLGLIEAFKRAFAPGAGAKLVLKSINARTRAEEHDRVVLAARGHDDISLIDSYISGSEKNAMIAACDCYISLHRSEGLGLTVAEAMLLGKPVIVTGYGGTMEFASDENSYLVHWQPVAVGEGAYPYSPESIWAEPDLDHAAALMRHAFTVPEDARRRGQIARQDVLTRHSPDAAGARMRRRLEVIYERLGSEGARSLNLTHLPSLGYDDAVHALIDSPPTIDWDSGRLARLRGWLQRPVAHWSRDFVEHHRRIDTETQSAIDRLDAQLREVAKALQDGQKAQHAETLAVLRRLEAEPAGGLSKIAAVSAELPPAELRLRVAGTDDIDWFTHSGAMALDDFEAALASIGRRYENFSSVYEFGCGCGRITTHLFNRLPAGISLFASDIDKEATSWLHDRLPDVDVRVNPWLPPLPYSDDAFDLIIGWSIFTHLPEDYQDAWLAELARVTRPGGIVLQTVAGESNFQWCIEHALRPWSEAKRAADPHAYGLDDLEAELRSRGFVFWTEDGWAEMFPDFYHTTYHLPSYIRSHWSQWFEIIDVRLEGGRPNHDVVVMRSPQRGRLARLRRRLGSA